MKKQQLIIVGGVAGLVLLGTIATMLYTKGYPWTCSQAQAEEQQALADGVAASEAYAKNLLNADEDAKRKFSSGVERVKKAVENRNRLCR